MRSPGLLAAVWTAAAILSACADGKEPQSPADAVEDEPHAPRPRTNGGPKIESEIGALDEKAVAAAFREVRPKIKKCLRGANDGLDLPVVGGELEVQLRVKGDGSLRWVYPMRSTLGHRSAEKCVLDALMAQSWPKPEGGDEGLARTDYGIDPPGRAPVRWSAGDLGSAASEVESALNDCMSDAGAKSLSVTIYVDADGNAITAGGAVGDENGTEAIDCAVNAVKAIKFPSPGSYPAKVTIKAG
jgi:hypothetical protein